MEQIILEKQGIIKHQKTLEKKLHVKLSRKGRLLELSGDELDEYVAVQVIEALQLGFNIEIALLLLEPDFVFEKVEIKNYTRRHNLIEVRARVVGKQGRTKALIEELSDCHISLHNNVVGVIGESEKIKTAIQSVIKLVQGSKQSSVYAYLEKQRGIHHPHDLGLKE